MVVNSKRQNELKPLGVLLQNDREHFSVRLLSRAGNFTAEDIINIAHLSKKYGQGYVGETTRLQIEIPWIKDEDVEEFLKEAETLGLKHGGTGPSGFPGGAYPQCGSPADLAPFQQALRAGVYSMQQVFLHLRRNTCFL